MHKVAVDHYVVYYVVNSDRLTVQIIRIFYGGRDAEAILQSETNKE
jgi:plasmid stabilization system protein ParE